MKKWIKLAVIFWACVLFGGTAFASEETDKREDGIPATFMDGSVTKALWQEEYQYIGVNNIVFVLMPAVHVYKMSSIPSGAFERKDLTAADLQVGDPVKIKIHGNRVFEIIVLEEGNKS